MRLLPLIPLGGCLIGWQPEPISACDTAPELLACPDVSDPQIEVGSGLTPTFTWDEPGSDLYVYEGETLIWHVWTNDAGNHLASGIVYGTAPAGTSEGMPAPDLVAGHDYTAQLDVLCASPACDVAPQSFATGFTP
jgi:hypothetical protein